MKQDKAPLLANALYYAEVMELARRVGGEGLDTTPHVTVLKVADTLHVRHVRVRGPHPCPRSGTITLAPANREPNPYGLGEELAPVQAYDPTRRGWSLIPMTLPGYGRCVAMRITVVSACLTLALALTAPASAQDDPDDPRVEQARALFQAGRIAFEAANYEDALRHFRESYQLSGRAELLYNIGVAADRLREDEQALEAFEHYLRETPPGSPQRADAEVRVRVLRRQIEARPGGETARDASPNVGPATGGGDSPLAPIGYGTLAVGGATLVGGVVMLVMGQLDAATVEAAMEGSRWQEVADAWARADWMRVTGWVLAGVGVAAAAVGLTLVLVAPSGGSSTESVSLRVQPNGLELVWRGM